MAVLEHGDGYLVLPRFFVPQDGIRRRSERDGVPYASWAEQGHIIATAGAVVDYGVVEAYIAELAERYRVEAIAIDRWNSTGTQTRLQEIGLPVVAFGQGFASMSPACKEVERLILNRQLAHDGNPVMRWCLSNVAIAQDPAGNIKIDRQKAKEKVDGAVALAMAIGVASCRAGRVHLRGAAELPGRLTHRKTIAVMAKDPEWMDQVRYAIIPTVAAVAEILALAPRAQPWRNEAPCRALIRRLLCLDGEKMVARRSRRVRHWSPGRGSGQHPRPGRRRQRLRFVELARADTAPSATSGSFRTPSQTARTPPSPERHLETRPVHLPAASIAAIPWTWRSPARSIARRAAGRLPHTCAPNRNGAACATAGPAAGRSRTACAAIASIAR